MAQTTEMTPATGSRDSGTPSDVKDVARERAAEMGGTAQEKAQEAKQDLRGAIRRQVDHRSTGAGERIKSTGSDLHSVGEELRKQGKDTPAKLADQAAQRVERAGDYLQRSDADTILDDIEGFGRRQPVVLLAGGLVAGLALARFMKASSGQRYRAHQTGQTPSLPSPTPVSPAEDNHSTRFEPHS
jgi:hypothetical protein